MVRRIYSVNTDEMVMLCQWQPLQAGLASNIRTMYGRGSQKCRLLA